MSTTTNMARYGRNQAWNGRPKSYRGRYNPGYERYGDYNTERGFDHGYAYDWEPASYP